MDIPIVIFHIGYTDYLKFALNTAKKFNEEVILIGDQSNKKIWNNHYNALDLSSKIYDNFLNLYKSMSSYKQDYEIFIFQRFFCLREWMKQNQVYHAFVLDSDVITFANFSKLLYIPYLQNYEAALSIPKIQEENYRWAAYGHNSYWTYEGIESFTDFCIETYGNNLDLLKKKYEWHLENKALGGICEMTLLYLWSKDKKSVFNTAQVYDGMTIDNHITSSENFEPNEYLVNYWGIKSIKFKNGMPYGFNKILGENVRFLALHCQGSAKKYMEFFANERLRSLYQLAPIWHLTNKVKKRIQGQGKQI